MIDIQQQRCGFDGCIAWRLSRPGSNGLHWQPCWACGADVPPPPEGCTCTDTLDGCQCRACAELATTLAACLHRHEEILVGRARIDRSYDGLCDGCFLAARAVHACGLRVAEHADVLLEVANVQ